MNGLAFFDTNVMVWADDKSSPEKQNRAIWLFAKHLRNGTAVVSLHVVQEYYAAATRKLKLAPEFAQRKVGIPARARVVRFDVTSLRPLSCSAGFLLGRHDRSRGPCGGAVVLYSEGFQSGAILGGVRVENPFIPD